MTAPFRPSVLPQRGPDNLDTFSRALEGAFGFVEDIRSARQGQAEFNREERMAGLRSDALRQELDIRGRAETERILRDPTLITAEQRDRLEQTGRTAGREPAKLEGAFEAAAAPEIQQPTAEAPAAAAVDPGQRVIERPEEVFAPGGEAVDIPQLDVTAPPPERPGVPEIKPPSVSDAFADQISPQRRERPELGSIGDVQGLGEVFFDPQGGQREAFQGASFAGEQIRAILNRTAQQAEQSGQQAIADRIRERIETGVARIEAGGAPQDVVESILEDARSRERAGAQEEFLTGRIEELGGQVPGGVEILTPEGRVAELQNTRNLLEQQTAALQLSADRAEQLGDVGEQERFNAQVTNQIITTFNQTTRSMVDAASGFAAMEAAFVGVQAANPASALAMMFAYGKVLDPGSVVREGEVRALQAIGAVDDRIRRMVRLATAGTLPVDLAKNILDQARGIMEQRAITFGEMRDAAVNRARVTGLDVNDIEELLPDPFRRFFEPGTPEGDAEAVRRLTPGFDADTTSGIERNPGRGRQ